MQEDQGSYPMSLTMTEAMNQRTIDSGSATMYRTLPTKCNSSKKLPRNPQASETAFKEISLLICQ